MQNKSLHDCNKKCSQIWILGVTCPYRTCSSVVNNRLDYQFRHHKIKPHFSPVFLKRGPISILLSCWWDFHVLTLKAPVTTAADDIHKIFFHCFSEKITLDVSSESSARQRIHMKNQALFSSKDKTKKLKCRLLLFLFGTLRVKVSLTAR